MGSIKNRLLGAFLLVIAIFSIASFIFFILNFTAVQQYKSISDNMIAEYRMVDNTTKLIDAYNVYLQSAGTSTTKSKAQIEQAKAEIKELSFFLDTSILNLESKANYLGFNASVTQLIKKVDDSIKTFEQGSIKNYFSDYNEVNKEYGFVRSNGTSLIFSQLKYSTSIQNRINQTYFISITLGLSTLVLLIIGCTIFVIQFASKLTKPLTSLTNASEQLASGKMEVVIDNTLLEQKNELGTLAQSFNTMTLALREKMLQLDQEKKKAEENLHEVERVNALMTGREIKMIELKKEIAELKAKNSGT